MAFLFLIGIAIMFFGIYGLTRINKNKEITNQQQQNAISTAESFMMEKIDSDEFKATKKLLIPRLFSGIAIDTKKEKILLFYLQKNEMLGALLNFTSILKAEIKTDLSSYSVSNRTGGIVGAKGVYVAQSRGNRISGKQGSRIMLEVYVDNIDNPIIEIPFFMANGLIDQNNSLFQNSLSEAETWKATIDLIKHK